MSIKTKGVICGIIAATTYGTNPLGALPLYADGINVSSVLFYRYTIAMLILGMLMVFRRELFQVSLKDLGMTAILGVLFATSSITLFTSFHYMDAGIASTILFVYPIMVAVMMTVFFKEKITLVTSLSITLAIAGIALLYRGPGGETLNTTGVLLVMLSSLSYASYIVIVNRSSLNMSAFKLTFYVLLFCILTIIVYSFISQGNRLQLLSTPKMWGLAIMLGILPTVVSLLTMVIAVKAIGSTPTAIMGALEPLTAVAIGVTVFGEQLTPRLVMGILLILAAVITIISGKGPAYKLMMSVIQKSYINLYHLLRGKRQNPPPSPD